jgi:hypothetical protein
MRSASGFFQLDHLTRVSLYVWHYRWPLSNDALNFSKWKQNHHLTSRRRRHAPKLAISTQSFQTIRNQWMLQSKEIRTVNKDWRWLRKAYDLIHKPLKPRTVVKKQTHLVFRGSCLIWSARRLQDAKLDGILKNDKTELLNYVRNLNKTAKEISRCNLRTQCASSIQRFFNAQSRKMNNIIIFFSRQENCVSFAVLIWSWLSRGQGCNFERSIFLRVWFPQNERSPYSILIGPFRLNLAPIETRHI